MAVDLVRQVHHRLKQCRLVLVGAGEMITLCARHLADAGVRDFTIVNRSRERAVALAAELSENVAAKVSKWADLPEALATADIVISCTAATAPVITDAMVRKIRYRPQVYLTLQCLVTSSQASVN